MENINVYVRKITVVLFLFVSVLVLSACTIVEKESYLVIFNSNGGTAVDSVLVEAGETVDEPASPTKENYTFDGWYTDSGLNTSFNFTSEINEEIVLYAKWVDPSDATSGPGLVNVLSELPTDEEIEIVFWHSFGGDKEDLLDTFIDEFETMYPNVTILALNKGTYDLNSQVAFAVASEQTPTMIIGQSDQIAQYASSGIAVPLDDFIYDDNHGIDLSDFIDSYVEESRQFTNGYMYSLPYSKFTETLIINKSIFEANGLTPKTDEPYTWAELEALSSDLVGDGEDQCEYLINYDVPTNLFTNSVIQWDGEFINADADILVDNTNTKTMMQYLRDRFGDKTLAIPDVWGHNYGSEKFIEEAACMLVTLNTEVSYAIPASSEFEVVFGLIPQYDLNNQSVFQQGLSIVILRDHTDAEKLASWLFLKYITNAENTSRWALESRFLPVRYSGYLTDDYQDFLNNPSALDIYNSMSANASYLQIDYFAYTEGFVRGGLVNSIYAKELADLAVIDLFDSNDTIQEIVDSILSELGAD